MAIIEMKDLTVNELVEIMENNTAFYFECKETADEFDTEWALNDFLRNVPRCVRYEIGGYCDYMRADWYISREGQRDIICWLENLSADYGDYFLDGVSVEKVREYIDVLDDYTIYPAEKDETFMENFIDKNIEKGLQNVLDEIKAIYNQFDDKYYLADCLLSCALLDDYYMVDGEIYRRMHDKKIA